MKMRKFSRLFLFLSVLLSSVLFAEPNDVRLPDANKPRRFPKSDWSDFNNQPDKWYRSPQGIRIANNILSWQSPQGSWPKNTNTTIEPFTKDPNTLQGTFDNGATTNEIRFLARAFRVTGEKRYQQAVLKAVDHIFKAQYPNGGWPQFYPPGEHYPRYITFNDNTMVHLMYLMREVASSPDFNFIDDTRRKAAQESFDRGVECILECQIKVNGKLTVWCAQHDEQNYDPRPARIYELVSLSGYESSSILELLMSLDNPDPKVVRAIEAGVEWYENSKITGISVIHVNRDRVVIKDPNAPPIWARFYEIETNRPFFCGRDGVKKYSLAEVEKERRGGYSWYGRWGDDVAANYEKWKQKRRASASGNK